MINVMAKEYFIINQEGFMKETGRTILNMGGVWKFLTMVHFMMAIMLTENQKGLANFNGLMVKSMKVSG